MFSCLLISFGDQNPSACFVSTGAVGGQLCLLVVLDGGALDLRAAASYL